MGTGVTGILGKRKSERSPPSGLMKRERRATPIPTPPPNQEEIRKHGEPPSSSSSDAGGLEDLDQVDIAIGVNGMYTHPMSINTQLYTGLNLIKGADLSRNIDRPPSTSTSLPHLANILGVSRANQEHISQSRIIRERRSASACKCAYNIAREDSKNADGSGADIATLRCQQEHKPGFPIVYRIECPDESSRSRRHDAFFYEDDPMLADVADGRRSSHLSGNRPIYQLQDYVRHFQWLSFVIVKNRYCGQHVDPSSIQNSRSETILILGDDLRRAIQKVATCSLTEFVTYGSYEFRAPYQPLYFHIELLQSHAQSVDAPLRGEIEALIGYVMTNFGKEYTEAEHLLSQSQLTLRHLDKICRPNYLVVSAHRTEENGLLELGNVYVVQGWPKIQGTLLIVHRWSWQFTERECRRSLDEVNVPMPVQDESEIFTLDKLGLWPISAISEESIETLRCRGREAWDLRQPKFVYCTGSDRVKPGRYMIDQEIYDKFHPDKSERAGIHRRDRFATRNKQTDPWRLYLGLQDEPTDDELLMMPMELPGYDLLEKEWISLPVASIRPIDWHKQPFDDLVLPEETKRLVRAMVTVRASSIKMKREKLLRTNFDIVPGKGNGLIMLFHGSPGTGKTLTAESVAEIAEMPLYPITCGNIGTEPEKVEEYLRSVFELGSRWNCVLLLDEADVFLEERTLTDLQRNSLVSVFLRMLEYYEGILILTSNRVGTFDEAFRSRINIAIHYEDLKPRSRKLIWSNFLARLEGTDEGENIAEIENRLDELANHKLNGREIRNALSTARQLASYEGKVMGWEHLELAIKTANKFGSYLREVHGHSDSDWAKERRERL